jgi:membrane protein
MAQIAVTQEPSAPPTRLKNVVAVLRETISQWIDDDASRLAASLAFYTLLSIAPLIVVAIAVAGLAFGEEAARGQIASEVGAVVGRDAGNAIQSLVANAKTPSSGILSSVVGVSVLLVGASGVFNELQTAMNAIWEVKPKPGRGIRGVIRDRFFSLTMVLGVAFLLLVSLVISAGLAAAGRFFAERLPGGEAIWQVANFAISLGITTLLFALTFKIVPDAKIHWHEVWVGALVTATLFNLGKLLLALYIGRSATTSAYGAAGSLVALVVWVYYSSQILFLGAEFTQVYAQRSGKRIVPSDDAVAAGAPVPPEKDPRQA